METIDSKHRIVYIDWLKAFAIFLVVLGHVCQSYGKNVEITIDHYGILPYHMPLFAILSGLFFSAKFDFKSFISKKFKQLALPFLVWCIIVHIVIRGISDTYYHLTEGLSVHFKSWIECLWVYGIMSGFWFLRALFLSFVYAYLSIRVCKNNSVIGILLSVVCLYVLSLSGIIPNMFFCDFVFLYPFFCTGILMKEYKPFIFTWANTILLISTMTFCVCMCFWQGYADTFYSMNTSMFEPEGYAGITGWMVPVKIVYRFITGISASLMLILLARKFEKKLPTPPMLMSIGRNTLGIYILHSFAFNIFTPPSSNTLIENQVVSFIACLTISAIIVIVCDYIINYTSRNQWLALLLWGKKQ